MLSATESDDGWRKVVVWPAAMLKLCQFKTAAALVVMLSCEPLVWSEAEPCETVKPVGFADEKLFPAKNNATANGKILDLKFIMRLELVSDAEISLNASGGGRGCGQKRIGKRQTRVEFTRREKKSRACPPLPDRNQ
jgi:hypothetical protein